jgi:hypothetical protein
MIDGVFWVAWILVFFGLEGYALWKRSDDFDPLTYHIRNVFSLKNGWRSPGWWLVGGFIGWLGVHFLIQT